MTIAIANMDSVFMAVVIGGLCRQRCEAKTQLRLGVAQGVLRAALPFANKLPDTGNLKEFRGCCLHNVTVEDLRRRQDGNVPIERLLISSARTVSGARPRARQTLRNANGEEYSLAVSQR